MNITQTTSYLNRWTEEYNIPNAFVNIEYILKENKITFKDIVELNTIEYPDYIEIIIINTQNKDIKVKVDKYKLI